MNYHDMTTGELADFIVTCPTMLERALALNVLLNRLRPIEGEVVEETAVVLRPAEVEQADWFDWT